MTRLGNRVVAGVSGSLGSLTALHRAASEARVTGAALWAVLAWEPPGGNIVHRGGPCPEPMAAWRNMAAERLIEALETAFGTTGPGVPLEPRVVLGTPGTALLAVADHPDDLLVIGAGARGPLRRALWPSVSRYCLARACCPVLAVPHSPLHRTLHTVQRRNTWKLPFSTQELTGQS
ncbi:MULTISPECIES: universal stress protein [unclassified Streptomyces]|uniref:universal stress protein n=1 Tax=unclassified Streptomyces TaxID=2593676 RepID=UPI0003717970|nr:MULTISPECIES: universal stress protein [unclassified Streptomyces]MYT33185.1 universal stress protein [Streptomyces sp. SID8354]